METGHHNQTPIEPNEQNEHHGHYHHKEESKIPESSTDNVQELHLENYSSVNNESPINEEQANIASSPHHKVNEHINGPDADTIAVQHETENQVEEPLEKEPVIVNESNLQYYPEHKGTDIVETNAIEQDTKDTQQEPCNEFESYLEKELIRTDETNLHYPSSHEHINTNEASKTDMREEIHEAESSTGSQPIIVDETHLLYSSSNKQHVDSDSLPNTKPEENQGTVHRQANEDYEPLIQERSDEVDSKDYYYHNLHEPHIETIKTPQHENFHHSEEAKRDDEDQPLVADEIHFIVPSEVEANMHNQPRSEPVLREREEDSNEEVQDEVAQHVGDPNLDNEFYQHSLQYLVQNLNNLRDTLQTILTNSEVTQELQGNNIGRGARNFLPDEGMNNNQQNNNDDQLHDQLLNIRRLLAGSLENNNAQNNAFDWDNAWNNRPNNQQEANNDANRENWGQRIETYARQIFTALPKDINTISWLIFILVTIFLLYCFTAIPDVQKENPIYLVDWLASHKDSRMFVLASSLFYLCAIFKFSQVLHTHFVSDAGEDYYKSFLTVMRSYCPFYDLGLYIFIDGTIARDKLEYFFVIGLLAWYTISTKLVGLQHQKLNQAAASIHNNTDQNLSKMKRIQFASAIYLIINSQIAYTVVWLAGYSSYLIIFVLSALSLLAITEPLKVFLSSTILVKNYTLVSNNNTRELSDPKFKVELLIDLVNQFVILLLIIILGVSYAHQVTGFVAVYWLSFTNSIEKLKNCYNKYSNWLKLQKRLDDIFPIVERSEEDPEELCSICHENLLIARKLPCGHIFHLKCLVYWLDNQNTCPNCRATMANLNEIMGNNNRQEGTISRVFNQLLAPFRPLFNRA